MIEATGQRGAQSESAAAGRVDISVEPWPAGGWAIWVGGRATPVSRHDTEEEAQFRAAAYRRGVARGQQLAFNEPHPALGQQRLSGGDEQLIDLVCEVLVDPNVHTDLRMRLQDEITEVLHSTPHVTPPRTTRVNGSRAATQPGHVIDLLTAVLTDPKLPTDLRMRLHHEIRELLGNEVPVPSAGTSRGRHQSSGRIAVPESIR